LANSKKTYLKTKNYDSILYIAGVMMV